MKRLGCIFVIAAILISTFGTCINVHAVTELIVNGDFEDGLTGWTLRVESGSAPTPELKLAKGMGIDGSDCAHITNTALGRLRQEIPALKNAVAGTQYKFTAWVKLDDPTKAVKNKAEGENGGNAHWGGLFMGAFWANGTEWTKVTNTWTVNDTDKAASRPYFQLWISESKIDYGCGYYVDNITVEPVTTTAVGEYSGTTAVTYESANVIEDGKCEDVGKWKLATAAVNNGSTLEVVSDGGTDGSGCLKIAGAYSSGLRYKVSGLLGARKNEKIYISAKIKADTNLSANTGTITMAYDGTGINGTVKLVENFAVTTEWTTVSAVYQLTDNITDTIPMFEFKAAGTATTDSGTVYIDDVVLITDNSIKIDGIKVGTVDFENFDPEIDACTVMLPYGTTTVPEVTAIVSEYATGLGIATYSVEQATEVGGAATVMVTSPNGRATKEYTVNFKEMDPIGLKPITFSGSFAIGQTVTATLPVRNNSISPIMGAEVTLIIAIYDENGALVTIKANDATDMEMNSLEEKNLTASITVAPDINTTKCRIGAFAIDSFTSGKPLNGMHNY